MGTKRILYSMLGGMVVAPFVAVYSYFQEAHEAEVRKLPQYYVYPEAEHQRPVFATADDECLATMYEYYRGRLDSPIGLELAQPPCCDHLIFANKNTVYLISIDSTGRYAKIGHFYFDTNPSHIQYFEGYVPAETLHREPR
jgi:hypothetical protein